MKSVKIGNQEWMAENLAVNDGGDGIYYNETNGQYYYTWGAAMRIAKSIPGWHLPSAEEWNAAAEACGATVVDNKWKDNPYMRDYEGAERQYDAWRVLLAGHCSDGGFYNVGTYAYFWSAVEFDSDLACYRYFGTRPTMHRGTDLKDCGLSVRLVKD